MLFVWKERKRTSVTIFNEERGSTLIELLLYVATFIIIAFITVFFIMFFQKGTVLKITANEMQWGLFEYELHQMLAAQPYVDVVIHPSTTLRLVEEHRTTFIEKYQDMIRFRSHQGGHVPLLVNVQDVFFSEERGMIVVTVTMKGGEQFEGYFYPYIQEELEQ